MFFCKSSAIVLFVLFLSFCGSAFGLRDQDRKVSCRQPTPVDNAELEPEYEKKESFKNDDIVKYHCKHGYTIEGKSRERKCNNGEWSGIMFTCTYITCSYVHPPENGRRLDTNNGVGDYTEFDCDTGYTLKGYKKLLCRSNREWQPPDPPRCDPILCPELPGVRNGRVFQNDAEGIRNDYESVSEYTCNSGYYLNGQTKTRVYERKCQANGTWSGKQPICDVPRCENISPNFHNGTVRYFGDRKLWSHAFYKCDKMHSLYPTDREMSECTKAVRWEPEPPECKAMAEKVIPDHGYESSRAKKLLHHLDYYTVRCFSDYELYSGRYLELDSLRITNIDGSLTPKVPECIEERCSIDVPDAYCFWEGDTESCKRYDFKIPSQSTVNMKCKDGFKLFKSEYGSSIEVDGHASIFCRKGSYNKDYKCIPDNLIGTLQQYFSDLENTAYNLAETIERFTCRYLYHMSGRCKDPCLVPEIHYGFALNRYRNIAKEVRHGAIISVGCNKGYTVSESMSTTCRYGEWSRKDFPKCIPNPCSLEIPAGTLHWVNSRLLNVEIGETKTFKNGTELQLQCQDGYRMKDLNSKEWIQNTRKTQTCVLGTWTHQYACSPEPCVVPTISNAKLQFSSNVKTYEHGKTLTFECDIGYNFDWSEFRKKTSFEAKCILGNWDKNIPKECKPDPCQLTLQVGTSYFVDSNLLTEEDGKKQTFENGTKLRTECNDGYRMKNLNSKKYLKHNRRQSTCLTGSWNRLYACYPEPCTLPRVSHATVSPKGTTQYDHEEKITFSCDRGFHFSQNINLTVEKFETTCNFGKWTDEVPQKCYPDGCKLKMMRGSNYYLDEGLGNKSVITHFRLIEHNTKIYVQCSENFNTFNNNNEIFPDTSYVPVVTCYQGKWRNVHHCRERCVLSEDFEGSFVQDRENITAGATIAHGESVEVKCDDENHGNDPSMECNDGKWENFVDCSGRTISSSTTTSTRPTETSPTDGTDRCKLNIHRGSKYYLDDGLGNKSEITTSGLIEHNTKVHVQCSEHYNIFNNENKIFKDTKYMPVVICYQGKWLNIHFCRERCVVSEKFDGWFVKDGKNITAGATIAHGENVDVKCADKLKDNVLSIECNDGKWKTFVNCSGRTSSSSTTASAQSTETSSTVTSSTVTSSTVTSPNETSSTDKSSTGCKLSDDQRFTYTDNEGMEQEPGSTIQNGITLKVSCAEVDVYDFYTDYYDSEVTQDHTEVTQDHTITCIGNNLTQTELRCPEVTPDSCLKLQNGNVTKEFDYFIVSCKEGYSLNLTIPEYPECTCKNGKLMSKYGNQEPACMPDDCVVPKEFDERLSVIDKDGVSLSGGSVVKTKDIVTFNCSKAYKAIYEPSDRKFTCKHGQWFEAEIEENWLFDNNGTFPRCREAICKPSCENGGVCFKDDTCRCSEFTKGERCQEVICDEKCLQNDGKCLNPGKCTCPKGRVGTNCEEQGCILPDNAAKLKDPKRTVFTQGEMLTTFYCDTGYIVSSRNGMSCLDDGSWSEIVKCEKAVHYLISVKTANKYGAGTDANVYITLNGHSGKTRRIYLQGSFESEKLDETREPAVDIRPIGSVTVGHDGSGLFPEWTLEYVSIFVENMDEYYVFRERRGPVLVTWDKDVVLPREDEHRPCTTTFDKGNEWYPRWGSIGKKQLIDLTRRRRIMTLRGCKQECINLKGNWCQAVRYDTKKRRCWGFAGRDSQYFSKKHGSWDAPVYLRICKPFN